MSCAILLSTRAAHGFVKQSRLASQHHSKLSMSVFDDIARAFSAVTGGAVKDESKFYTVGITGSSGLLGTALIDELRNQQSLYGKPIRIVKLIRSESVTDSQLGEEESIVSLPWNPKGSAPESVIDLSALADIDAVVHLAGENVATGLGSFGFLGIRPWTDDKKAEILNSRVGPTAGLAKAIAASKTPTTFVAASGVGVYGGDFIGDEKDAVDESMDTTSTTGFLADISRAWESATQPAGKNRVVNARMGVVMSKNGGARKAVPDLFPWRWWNCRIGKAILYIYFCSRRCSSVDTHSRNTFAQWSSQCLRSSPLHQCCIHFGVWQSLAQAHHFTPPWLCCIHHVW
jgi:NAD dependent epimerase/dehydratase family enzyme